MRTVRHLGVVGVLACLLFSVGEGLRLTPFPVSPAINLEASNNAYGIALLVDTSLNKYGPVDVPVQFKKPNKRQAVDFGGLTQIDTLDSPAELKLRTGGAEPVTTPGPPFRFLKAGRAPPLTS